MPYIGKKPADIIATAVDTTTGTFSGDIDVDGTTNLDVVDIDGAVNFAADVTFADGADIITASAGTSNFRAGVNAGNSITSGGNYNVLVGDEAGTAISTGDNNTLIGYAAGDALTTGSHNTFVGENAGTATTGSNNTGIGRHALTANTSGVNTAVGYTALDANTTGTSNVAVGDDALGGNVAGDQSVAIGTEALLVQNPSGNADMNNVAVGYRSGYAVTTGANNTIIGGLAGSTFTTGSRNTLLGTSAGLALETSNSDNTFVGNSAGGDITTGDANTILGRFNGNQGGLDIRTSSNNIVLADGDGNPRSKVVANGFTHLSGTTGIGRFGSMLGVTVADDASLTVQGSAASAGGLIITVYETGGGTGGCFYATFRGGTTLIAEGLSGDCAAADTDGKLCVFKSSGTHTVTFKNRLGASRTFYIGVYGAFVT
jgi:trimeric autotransporter adhesin